MSGPDPDRAARRDGHLPAWLVERLAFEPEAAPSADGHHRSCPSCRDAIEQLRREREAFLSARPARPFVAAVAARTPPRASGDLSGRSPWRWLLAGGLAAAGAAAVV